MERPSTQLESSPWDRLSRREASFVPPPPCSCRWWCLCITTCGGIYPPCVEACEPAEPETKYVSTIGEMILKSAYFVFLMLGGWIFFCPIYCARTARIIYRDGCILSQNYHKDRGQEQAIMYYRRSYAETLANEKAARNQDLEDIRQFNMSGGAGRQQITFASRYTDNTLSFKLANGRLNMLSNGDYLLRDILSCCVTQARVEVTGTPCKPGGSTNILVATPDVACAAQISTLFQQTMVAPTPNDMDRTKVAPLQGKEVDDNGENVDSFIVSALLPVAKIAFAKLDADGSGDLDAAEVRQLFVEVLGQPVEDDDFSTVFEKMDRNKDGRIDFSEFERFLPKFLLVLNMSLGYQHS